jgi:hypothetical protein
LLDWGPLPVLRFKQTKVAVDEGQIAKVIIERVPRDTDLIESIVNVRTTNITTSSNDFVPGSGLVIDYGNWDVVFQGGETEKALVWSLRQDGIVEKDEQFIVELTDVDMAVIDSATDTVAVTVHDENHSPIARNDGPVNVVAGKAVTIRALANDEDPDGDPISILRTNQGKASADGRSILYTAPNKTGPAAFSYTILDSRGATATATINVLVTNEAPIARNDGPVNVAAGETVMLDVLANDEDPDGHTISVTGTSKGKVSPDRRSISYTAPGRTGLDRLSYTIQDPAGATATATVAIRVTNDAPAATPDDGTTRRDVPVEIDVLRNDRDPDGHTLRVVEFTQGRHGTVTPGQGPDGNLLMYTPDLRYFKYGESGSDEFRYTVSDGYGGEATAGVKIWIVKNHEPTARDDEATVQFNKSGEIDVLKNDFDLDGDDITVTWTSKPAHGTVVQKTVNGKRLLAYTPAQGATADDQFTYRVSDGHGGSDEAVVRIKINRPPIAVPDDRSTVHNRPIEIPVLGNDTDPDQDPLHVARYTTASARGGTVRLKGSDLVVYTPSKNFVGTDQLQYTVSDGRGGEATTVVNIEVTNASPVTQLDRVTRQPGEAVEIPVLRNDTDPDGDELSLKSFDRQTGHGTVSRKGPNRPNVLVYTPKAGFTGTDRFTYTVDDGFGGTATGTVEVTVGRPNRGPVAQVDAVTVTAGQPIEIAVLANDSDPDGDSLSVLSFTTASANGGEVKRKGPNRPNVLIYNPRPGFVGTDQLQYTISDGKDGTATTVVNLVVKAAAATQKSAIINTGNVMHPLLTDHVLADGADWRRGSQELDEAIRLLALERR